MYLDQSRFNQKKQEARDDVTKHFPFLKAAISINVLINLSTVILNIKDIRSTYIMSALLCITACVYRHLCTGHSTRGILCYTDNKVTKVIL